MAQTCGRTSEATGTQPYPFIVPGTRVREERRGSALEGHRRRKRLWPLVHFEHAIEAFRQRALVKRCLKGWPL